MSGKDVSLEIKEKLKDQVQKLSIVPKLTIVQVGDREDSNVYIRTKIKFAQDVGVLAEHLKLPKSTTESEVMIPLNNCWIYLKLILSLAHKPSEKA